MRCLRAKPRRDRAACVAVESGWFARKSPSEVELRDPYDNRPLRVLPQFSGKIILRTRIDHPRGTKAAREFLDRDYDFQATDSAGSVRHGPAALLAQDLT